MVLAVGNRRGLMRRDATGAASSRSRWRSASRVHPGRTALARCLMGGFALSRRAPSKVDSARQVLPCVFPERSTTLELRGGEVISSAGQPWRCLGCSVFLSSFIRATGAWRRHRVSGFPGIRA